MTTPIEPVEPSGNGPHWYKSWSRKRKILTWAGGVFAALVLIGGISNAVSPPKPAPAGHVAVSATAKPAAAKPAPVKTTAPAEAAAPAAPAATQAPASPAPAATTPAAATPSAMDTWCAGTGATNLQAVKTDVNQISTDASNMDVTAVETDGTQLQADATGAAATPPPVSSAHKFNYTLAMGWYMIAGNKASTGDFNGASSALNTANGFIGKDQGVLPADCGG
jgi:hypothetical protein